VSHVREWRQQFDKLESVDLRYDRQIIVNPEQGTVKQTPLSILSVKAAVAAGMKPAALITHQLTSPKSNATLFPAAKPPAKVAASKKSVRRAQRRMTAAKAKAKTAAALAQNKSMTKPNSPAAQVPSATPAPVPSVSSTAGKSTPAAPPPTGAVVTKPGNKPSPAIAKGEHP
jgi:cell division protein FtsQ